MGIGSPHSCSHRCWKAGKELGAQSQSVLAQIEEFTSSSPGNEQSPWKKCCKYFSLSVRYSARQAPHSSSMIGLFLIKITDVTGHKSLEMLKTYSPGAEALVGTPARDCSE